MLVTSWFARKRSRGRCTACGQTNIVKDGVFECGVCGGALPPG